MPSVWVLTVDTDQKSLHTILKHRNTACPSAHSVRRIWPSLQRQRRKESWNGLQPSRRRLVLRSRLSTRQQLIHNSNRSIAKGKSLTAAAGPDLSAKRTSISASFTVARRRRSIHVGHSPYSRAAAMIYKLPRDLQRFWQIDILFLRHSDKILVFFLFDIVYFTQQTLVYYKHSGNGIIKSLLPIVINNNIRKPIYLDI